MITAAELVRKKRKKNGSIGDRGEPKRVVDIDDEIARLEAELAQDDGDSSSLSSSDSDHDAASSDNDSDNDSDDDNGDNTRKQKKRGGMEKEEGIVSLSTVKDDRIERLPEKCLPLPMTSKAATKKSKKRKLEGGDKQAQNRNSGLEQAVREVLSGYKARSAEKLPFYCRVCQKQYANKEEFFSHKELDFHKAAKEAERKATFCKLCRKQLTSPEQMKEHLRSKPHNVRLELVSSRQRQGQRNHRGRASSGGQSRRQWV